MGYTINPITGLLDLTGSSAASTWKGAVSTETALSTSGAAAGDAVVTLDTDYIWVFDGTTSRWINTGIKSSSAGSTPNTAGYSLGYTNVSSNRREYQLTLQPADATHAGVISTTTQTIAGDKSFTDDVVIAGDLTVQGTVTSVDTVNLLVKDKLITINDGGVAGSGGASGLEIEENALVTGYAKTSADRNSWELKAPNTAGIVTITPGASGFTVSGSSTGTNTGDITVLDTDTIDFSVTGQQLTGEVKNHNVIGVDLVATSAIPLSGEQTIDGVLTSGSRVLCVSQGGVATDPANGIYTTAAGAWTRSSDMDTANDFYMGMEIYVKSGTNGTNTKFIGRTAQPITLGSTSLEFRNANVITNFTLASGNLVTTGLRFSLNTSQTPTLQFLNGNSTLIVPCQSNDTLATLTASQSFSGKSFTSGQNFVDNFYWPNNSDPGPNAGYNATWFEDYNLKLRKGSNQGTNYLDVRHLAVSVISTSNLTLSGEQTIDGVLTSASRILVAGQSAGSQNGIYVTAAGAWTRANDCNVSSDLYYGLKLYVASGTLYSNTEWVLTTSAAITIGSTSLTFTKLSSKDAGDITQTIFFAANNQSSAADVTGLLFSNSVVRGFKALVTVSIDATSDLFEIFELMGVQKGASWSMSQTSTGDESNIDFTITSGGQVQYVSGNETGFVTNTMKFRAEALSI